jgi:hypothetical protein
VGQENLTADGADPAARIPLSGTDKESDKLFDLFMIGSFWFIKNVACPIRDNQRNPWLCIGLVAAPPRWKIKLTLHIDILRQAATLTAIFIDIGGFGADVLR